MTYISKKSFPGTNQKKQKKDNHIKEGINELYDGKHELKLVQNSEFGENLSGILTRTNRFFKKLLSNKQLIFITKYNQQIILAYTVLKELNKKITDKNLQNKLNKTLQQQELIQKEINIRLKHYIK